ncbi:MAG TPA: glutathione S-transferase family protein [Geminicoccus sp.]|uniref:glutathione S-transferase family protein n=1 Tax=Geminicoccus sp. TaxID=2024832 RepID=UPI002C0CF5CE|nr:glutathione S-transferase family protein [Geminicoccus sp.]HWL68873.1 glutathione S-transferase family protein [Geminicoccus sp.]
MQLYWAPKTRSIRILWLLEEIGQPYERVTLDIRNGPQTDPDFLRLNPMGKVPVLVDGQAVVSESGAIVAYLADRFPEARLAPPLGDPRRGQYLKWLFFSGNCIEGAFIEKFGDLKLPEVAAGWGSFARVVDVLEQAVADGPWLLGETFTAADVMIGADLHFGMVALRIIEPRPALTAYVERCQARPAWQRSVAIDEAG